MTLPTYLIYGANGYTGSLIAREAVARGHRPILAGRGGRAVAALAAELGVDHRAFGLRQPAIVEQGLSGVPAVLNCAGPFARTAQPLVDACLRAGVDYLDITGEIDVFESLAARDARALAANVTLLPGVGFDVVPTDCLAAHLKRRLPKAERLELAIALGTGASRGTAITMIDSLGRPGFVRRNGVIKPVPVAWKTRHVDFGDGPVPAVTIPWGDVSTAYYSTAIPDVEVSLAVSGATRAALRVVRYLRWLFKLPLVRRTLKGVVRLTRSGPSDEQRARGRSSVWGEVTDAEGRRAASRLFGPDGYTFTAHAALAAVERILTTEVRPGFLTPSTAFGADFVLELPGVTREDEVESAALMTV